MCARLLANAHHRSPLPKNTTAGDERTRLEAELNLLAVTVSASFKFATTKPYWTQKERRRKRQRRLASSITINP